MSRLDWSLFRGLPAPSSDTHVAEITTRYQLEYSIQLVPRADGSWRGFIDTPLVTLLMIPEQSWVLPGRATSAILRHEQCHFDIYEVYRRRIETALSGTPPVDGGTEDEAQALLQQAIHGIVDPLFVLAESVQAQFDAATNRRADSDTGLLADWEARVAAWLAAPNTVP